MTTYEVMTGAINGNFISGPFGCTVIKDDGKTRKVVSSVSNIPTAELCNQRALQLCDSFGATLPWGLIEVEA